MKVRINVAGVVEGSKSDMAELKKVPASTLLATLLRHGTELEGSVGPMKTVQAKEAGATSDEVK